MIFFKPLIELIILNKQVIEELSFVTGAIIIFFLAVFLAVICPIKKPSFLAVFHQHGKPPKSIHKLFARFLLIFFVITGFFLFVFNLFVEWIAIAIDAPLLMIIVGSYIIILLMHHKKMKFSPCFVLKE
ncbi:MAG: hypothetical protein IIB46_07065 [Nitrospinae bacterium]|nr:hypothetical protein [Nitrospinota bacterium]